ncbi:hypothetical protein GQ54DRAFT_217579 [Martensiomyces pterosporus]|nr:hypothetical protein GQ54DRAFT_217579 [Martensiomyces pterosporus]
MAHLQSAFVKLAFSGDSLVLRATQRGNQPPPERTLGLAYIQAPHLGNAKKGIPDEPFALESREFLRRRVVSKAVKFTVRYKTGGGREYGSVYLGPKETTDEVSVMLVHEGWAKVTDNARSQLSRSDSTDEEAELIERLLEEEEYARKGRRGMWSDKPQKSRPRLTTFDIDAEKFLAQNKGRELRATVEQVRDATTMRVTLHLPTCHQMITLLLTGVKAPAVRTNIPGQPDLIEPYGDEAKFNVEIRLLQQDVKVKLEGMPQGASASGTFVGSIIHPAGNIAEWLVSSSYAKVVDWSASYFEGGASKLRALERTAKAKRIRVWHGFEGPLTQGTGEKFDGTVIRVISGDTVLVHDLEKNKDREFQLSSIRQPRMSDPDQAGYAEQARESLRRLCIGKPVVVNVDYHKPAQDNFRARDCATIRIKSEDIGAHLVKNGLAGVLRYRADDNNRSSNYDELLAAETRAAEAKLGIHSGKPKKAPKVADASENTVRARSFITHWQRSGRVSCVVDYVSAGARLRLHIPRENVKLTFVLGGIRCPRAPRNDGEAGEPLGAEALEYTTRHAMQRDVEAEFEGVDKNGGFIGSIWLSKNENLAENLLHEGLATVHDFSAEQSPHTNKLYSAERRAKADKRGVWADFDAAAEAKKIEQQKQEAEKLASVPAQALKPRIEFLDVVVSELVSPSLFYVQIAKPSAIRELENLMADLAISQEPASADFAPKAGQLVSACYTVGDEWHRAKIRKALPGKKEFEVVYVDFGNSETIGLDRIRPLSSKFTALPAQAHEAQLAFLQLPSETLAADYVGDAFEEARRLVEGRQLVANVEARSPAGLLHLTLYDPALGRPVLEKSVNGELTSAGYAIADKRSLASLHNAAGAAKIEELANQARSAHRGMWEYGDITTADE